VAEYCNSEKNLLSTDGCSTRNATFRERWHELLRSTRHIIVLKNNNVARAMPIKEILIGIAEFTVETNHTNVMCVTRRLVSLEI